MSGEVPVPDHIPKEEIKMLVKPDNWLFFTQPPGMLEKKNENGDVVDYKENSKAENKKNLLSTYYENTVKGKPK